ncbi:hypothetical protein Bbelb_235030 [Branchiostoma belcheri]|nr:hypothetical protein Bbelb_235030 [Branchiostoma belcheri]
MANIGKVNPKIHIDGIPSNDAKATADAINATLSKITRSLPRLDINRLPAFLPAPQPPQVNVWDMYHKLRNVRTRKAAGPDNITGRLIKEFAFELSQPLTSILNASLNEGRVPKEWHEATVIPLPKTKPPKVSELRPVSLTSLLAKVCESFIAKWTMSDIITNIDPQQFGGLPGRSTTHCLVDILHHLSKTSDQRRTVSSIVMTDFAKAFDMVDHSTAMQRLLELGCRPSLLSWICDFLTGRRQRVLYQGTLSAWEDLTCGLPQGTVLAPIIFVAIINCATKDVRARDWKFVDDLTIIECRLLRQTSHLQEDLDTLERWSSESFMKLHPVKCKVMHVCFARNPPQFTSLHIDGHTLQEVHVAKLLGVWLQQDLKWNTHINYVVKQSSKRLFLLKQLKKFHLPHADLLAVYTCYVRPIVEYAAPVWSSSLTKAQSKQLEGIQHRACRIILGNQYTCYLEACSELSLPTLESRREELCMKFGRGLLNSPLYRNWLPSYRGEVSSRRTRTSSYLDTILTKTDRFQSGDRKLENIITIAGDGKEPIMMANGVAVSADNEIFVTSFNGVRVFSINGNYLRLFQTALPGKNGFIMPYDVAIGIESGHLWVVGPILKRGVNEGRVQVVTYSRIGQAMKKFDLGFMRPSSLPSIAIDVRNNKIIVGQGKTVKMFDPDGSLYRSFKASSGSERGMIGGVTSDSEGNILLTFFNSAFKAVAMYSHSGVKIVEFAGRDKGRLYNFYGISRDKLGNIIVADNGNNRADMFTNRGEFVRTIANIREPMAIAMGPDGEMVVTTARSQSTITIFPRHMVLP